jgi:hypothetical protein
MTAATLKQTAAVAAIENSEIHMVPTSIASSTGRSRRKPDGNGLAPINARHWENRPTG